MRIGVPKELAIGEGRVGMTHRGVETLTGLGHEVYICSKAGESSGILDEMYKQAGAKVVDNYGVYMNSDLIVKVKPPINNELDWLRRGQSLFCYLLPERHRGLTLSLINKQVTAIGYEGVVDQQGRKPLLMPMSEIAGKMAVFIGAQYLQYNHGGKGLMLGSIAGITSSEIVILGAGSAAYGAADIGMGIGCNVTILNRSLDRLRDLKSRLQGKGTYLNFSDENINGSLIKADLLINTVDQMGDKTNHLITKEMIKKMKKGSVIMDVACDKNGTIETSVPTSFDEPAYIIDGVIHCAIPNLPGAVPQTSSLALTNATQSFITKLAVDGFKKTLLNDSSLRKGLFIYGGHLLHKKASENFGIPYKIFESVFQG